MIALIYNHKIKKLNNEEVLFLYIDNQYEFAREFTKKKAKSQKLIKQVEKYTKRRKIEFNGVKIFLVVNGIALVSVLSLNSAPSSLKSTTNFSYHTNILKSAMEYQTLAQETVAVELDEPIELAQESVKPSEAKANVSGKTTSTASKTSNSTKKADATSAEVTSSPKENSKITEKTPVNNELMVTVYRSNGTNVTIALNEYLIGVVGAEMPASFQEEALKAQAIVARTYALKLINSGKKLTDTSSTQNYKDNNQLKTTWGSSYNTYYNKIKNAVTATDSEVIKYNNTYIDAVYHSTSNGQTTDAVDVWGNDVPYLKGVDSHWDKSATPYLKEEQKSFDIISLLLGFSIDASSPVEVLSRTSNNSVKEIAIGNSVFSGLQIRSLFGLRSTDFDFVFSETGVNITTKGYGHGVGMSQYGANGMAKDGYKYQQIIKHYYTGVIITKI